MRVLLHDFPAHPFQTQLASWFAARRHDVTFAYCPNVPTGRGDLPASSVDIIPLDLHHPFDRYRPARRVLQEWHYGGLLGELIRRVVPDVVLSANTPLLSQRRALSVAKRHGAAYVNWLQDFLSIGITQQAAARVPRIGRMVSNTFSRVERSNLFGSDHIIAIAGSFEQQLLDWGVPRARFSIIGNWAPVDQLPLREPDGYLRSLLGMESDRPLLVYSGTLGRKHRPRYLSDLAGSLRDKADVVVVSEGEGAEFLTRERAGRSLDNLHLLPYVPFDDLPRVLADADILLTLLEPAASRFSVPSKVLTYLCAARPILAIMPLDNPAARTIEEASAGAVLPPGDTEGWISAAQALLDDRARRDECGTNARAFAEREFDIDVIGPRFEAVLEQAVSHRRQPRQPGSS